MIQEYFSQNLEISTNERGGGGEGGGGGPNLWGEPILQKVIIIWSLLLYFNFKSCMERKFLVIS